MLQFKDRQNHEMRRGHAYVGSEVICAKAPQPNAPEIC